MKAFWLLIPLLVIRFGLLAMLDKGALKRAAHFPPMVGKEKGAYAVYQLANLFLFVYLFFLEIETGGPLFGIGMAIYGLGIIICTVSTFNFAKPGSNGINQNGLYRISRNPMYIGYFVYFLGCVLLTQSMALLIALIAFQISAHWIILSEERWCAKEFGEEYSSYMKKVQRYL
jgi:protein-S-isoprenylcysteine O-methyltransferase Ste14